MIVRLGLVLTAAALLLAGCASPQLAQTRGAVAEPADEAIAAEAPTVDAGDTLALLKTFSVTYPYRQSGGPTHAGARDALAKALGDAGLEVIRQKFPVDSPGAAYEGENVIGVKWGADPSRWVVVGAHYDITEGAVYGAYDDGSGTAMTVKLAEAFASVNATRTLAFVLFDAEERGLVGSQHFVKTVLDGSFEVPDVTVDAMIGLDMVGITWPHPAHLVSWENSDALEAKPRLLAAGVGVPESNLEFREPRGGVSDGASFIAADIPTAYFWSNWDDVVTKEGAALPVPYPFWHQVDTYDTMVRMAGDESTLEAGFQTVLDIVSPLVAYAASSDFTAP